MPERNRFTMHPKCERCGFKYGFHICVDLSTPEPRIEPPKKRAYNGRKSVQFTEEHRANLSAALQYRWDRIRERNRPRDEKIVERYAQGDIGIVGISKEFNVSKNVVIKVLKAAEAADIIKMRPQGRNVSAGA